MTLPATKRGFTLIELLVVIGILAVLLTITLIAINPARQFAQANNTKRRSDVNAILNSVSQYAADNRGNLTLLNLPTVAPAAGVANICLDATQVGCVDLCAGNRIVPTYITALPSDPQTGDANAVKGAPAECPATAVDYHTGYSIYQVDLTVNGITNHRIVVSAPGAELQEVISVTR